MEFVIPVWLLFLLAPLLLGRGTGHPVNSCRDQYPEECQHYVTRTLCDQPGITPACRHACSACVEPVEPCEDPEKWGRRCDDLCSAACNGRRCNRMTGQCLRDCTNGNYGAACELHCQNCDGGGCFKNGTCRTGCRQRWRGPQCDQTD